MHFSRLVLAIITSALYILFLYSHMIETAPLWVCEGREGQIYTFSSQYCVVPILTTNLMRLFVQTILLYAYNNNQLKIVHRPHSNLMDLI